MKKILTIIIALTLVVSMFTLPGANGRTKAYYSGDAINYNGRTIIGSPNMDSFELFLLDQNGIQRMAKVKSFRQVYSGYDGFNSLAFKVENGSLFAYLSDGTYIYKYNVTDLSRPTLIKQVKDNSWDWFGSVSVWNGYLVTAGSKGVKIWNSDLTVVDSYKVIANPNYYSVRISADGRSMTYVDGKFLKVYDTVNRREISSIPVYTNQEHSRAAYSEGSIYMVDDHQVKRARMSGDVEASFTHISNLGYDVSGLPSSSYVYFSDGIGIVKLTKSDLKPVRWAYTTEAAGSGGWAMGLKVISDTDGEKVILFNNTNISVYNSSMKLVASWHSTEETNDPIEGMYLRADKNHAAGNSNIALQGGGFGTYETVTIQLAGAKYLATTDSNGRFNVIITVPTVRSGGYDIIATGGTSGMHYNLGFQIE